MTGLTGLLSSSRPAQVSSGKRNLYLVSLPAVKATIYLNAEGNLEFVAKYRDIKPLYHFMSAVSALQTAFRYSNALQGEVTCSHHCWRFCIFFGPENMSQMYQLSASGRPINSQVHHFQKKNPIKNKNPSSWVNLITPGMRLLMAVASRHKGPAGNPSAHSCPCSTTCNPSEEQTGELICLTKDLASFILFLI